MDWALCSASPSSFLKHPNIFFNKCYKVFTIACAPARRASKLSIPAVEKSCKVLQLHVHLNTLCWNREAVTSLAILTKDNWDGVRLQQSKTCGSEWPWLCICVQVRGGGGTGGWWGALCIALIVLLALQLLLMHDNTSPLQEFNEHSAVLLSVLNNTAWPIGAVTLTKIWLKWSASKLPEMQYLPSSNRDCFVLDFRCQCWN